MSCSLNDITIRTQLQPGDIGYLIYLHGWLYHKEYNYQMQMELYIADGMSEFCHHYDAQKDAVWIAEHNNRMVGFVLLMHRPNNAAQLRYFLIHPDYRGIGLGKKLMNLYMDFLRQQQYASSYLWTTSDLHTAAALYKKNGFVLTEEKPSAFVGIPVVEQKYEWRS